MRSLVFIALIGLALAVPVPKAESESDIFFEAELPEDCYADTEEYSQAQTQDDLQIDNIVEEVNDDCNDDPIEEEDLIDIQIDEVDEYAPAADEVSIKFDFNEEYVEDDCIDENNVTEQPPVITTPEPRYETTADGDCYSDDSEDIDEGEYFDLGEQQGEPNPLDTFDTAYVEMDQVFNNEFEQEQEGFEECVEY